MNTKNKGDMKKVSCFKCGQAFLIDAGQIPDDPVTTLKEVAEHLIRGESPLVLLCGGCLQAIAEIHRIQRSN